MSLSITRAKAIPVLAVLLISAIGTSLLLESHASPAPSANGYYQNLPANTALTALKSGATCSAEVKGRNNPWEPKTENNVANKTLPSASQLASFHAAENNAYYARVDGNFAGTTDQIIQWGACKWGFEDNIFRAQAVIESSWLQSAHGDPTTNLANCPADADKTATGCYQSYGLLQDKWIYHKGAYPMYRYMTAFQVDYALAQNRICYDRHAGDYKGCLAEWYSGNYEENGAGSNYVGEWQNAYAAKTWLTWPDKSTVTAAPASEKVPPTVSLTNPLVGDDEESLGGIVNISALANDNVGVSRVELYVDDKLYNTDTTQPYSFSWDTRQYVNGSHVIQAKAYDAAANQGSSTIITLQVENEDTTAPSIPTGVTATANNSGEVQINWRPSTDANGILYYDIWRSSNSDPEDIIGSVDVEDAANGFTDDSVEPGVTYQYKVEAVDTSGNSSGLSPAATVTVPAINENDDITPPEVEITAPEDGDIVSKVVNVAATVTDDTAVTKVEFYFDGELIATKGPASSTNYTASINTIQYPNDDHSILVTAYDAAGNTTDYGIFVTTNNTFVQMTPPSSVRADRNASNGIVVTWNISTIPGIGYYIQRATGGGLTTVGQVAGANTRTFTDNTAAANGSTYRYQVVAFDAAGNSSEPSALSNGVTLQPPPPLGPNGIKINAGGSSYNPVPGAAGWLADSYFTGGSTDAAGTGKEIAGTDLDPIYRDERFGNMSYAIPVANGRYTVRLHFAEIDSNCQRIGCRVFNIRVNDEPLQNDYDIFANVGGYAADVQQADFNVTDGRVRIDFTAVAGKPQIAAIEILPADVTAPSAPTNLVAKAVSHSQVNLTWKPSTDNIGVAGYEIYRNGEFINAIPATGGTGSAGGIVYSWGDTDLKPNTSYSYTVKAYDVAENRSGKSNTATAKTPQKPAAKIGNIKGAITTANPTNPYKCPTDPELKTSTTAPAKGTPRYICTQKLQWSLNLLVNANLKVDGNYSKTVCPAVNKFKGRVGLAQDCVFGKIAWGKLEELTAKTAPAGGTKIVYRTPNGVQHVVTAGPKGNYAINKLPVATYNFTYSLPNYASQTAKVTIKANQTVTKNVTLKHL